MVKLCKDCKYFVVTRAPGNPIKDLCYHPKSMVSEDLIWGETKYCHANFIRREGQPCGKDGKLFEQKPEPKPWWKLW